MNSSIACLNQGHSLFLYKPVRQYTKLTLLFLNSIPEFIIVRRRVAELAQRKLTLQRCKELLTD